MAMLAAAAIAAGMWPPCNRRAVNKQRYHCTSTEDCNCNFYVHSGDFWM